MERIIGIALSRYLATYIKNFSASQFQNWSLKDLEFKEEIVQDLIGIPPNFQVKKVTCNQIYTKIPWKKLGSDPIIFVADTFYVELEEPDVVVPLPPKVHAKKTQQGFTDRIIDNIQFEVTHLQLKIQLLGKEYREKKTTELPPCLHVTVKDINMHSTNSKWEVVDLKEVFQVAKNDEVLIFKEIHVGSLSMQMQPKEGAKHVPVIESLPVRVRLKQKKAFFGGPMLFYQIEALLPEELKLSLHQVLYKQLQDVIDAVLECLYRNPNDDDLPAVPAIATPQANGTPTTANDTGASTVPSAAAVATPAPANRGYWGRFTNILGSYSSWGSGAAAPEAKPETAPTAVAAPETPATSVQSEEAQPIAEELVADTEEEFVPDEAEGTLIADDEDFSNTAYTVVIPKGAIELHEYYLETTRGIASIAFSDFQCSFIPRIKRQVAASASEDGKKTKEVAQAEAKILIGKYGVKLLEPGTERHPEYIEICRTVRNPNKDAMFVLDFIKLADLPGQKPEPGSKTLNIASNDVHIVFDLVIWESIYMFFLGDKGKRIEQMLEQNLELVIQAALSNTFKFCISSRNPTIVLPPFAGKFLGKPHLASKVMKMHLGEISIRSSDATDRPPRAFQSGVFVEKDLFPARPDDFTSYVGKESPYTIQKFIIDIDDLWIELKATPEALSERVLKPFKMLAHIERREFIEEPKKTPQMEVLALINDIDFRMNNSQYFYFLEVYGERLAWNPHRITDEKKEIMRMEHLLKAAESGVSASDAVELKFEEDKGLLVSVCLHVEKARIQLLERVARLRHRRTPSGANAATSQANGHESLIHPVYNTLAEMKFDKLQYMLESHHDKNVTKVAASTFRVRSPQHAKSPFSDLVSPLEMERPAQRPALLVRFESYKPPSGAPADWKVPSMTWTELHEVQICFIYTTLAKIQMFFGSDEIDPEFSEESARKFVSQNSFSQAEAVSMNWAVAMKNTEFVIVENPDSPECAPMQLLSASISRNGVTKDEIHYEFDGQCSFFSNMWTQSKFERDSMTMPFLMKVLYIYQKDQKSNQWNTDTQMYIKDLDVTVSRRQFIMLQNILDNQMSDIRDVSSMRQQMDPNAPPPLPASLRLRTNRFAISIQRFKMALQSNKETFAVVNLQNFTYATENWTHVWTMLIEADYASIISTKEVDARSPFATILQPRTDIKGSATPPSSGRFARKFAGGAGRRSQPGSRSPSRRSRFGSTGSQPEEPIIASIKEAAVMEDDMTQSTRLFRLKLERKSPDALATAEGQTWTSKWSVDLSPLHLVYIPEAVTKLQEFFTLMEEHKNLRREYQRIQKEVSKFYKEKDWFNPDLGKTLQERLSKSQGEDKSSPEQSTIGTVFSITVRRPFVQLPEQVSESVTSVMEVQADKFSLGNDNESTYAFPDLSRTDILASKVRLGLKTVDMEKHGSVIQSQEIIHPVNIRIVIESKMKGPNGTPFMHLQCDIDLFAAIVSLKKYQTMIGIANNYLAKLFQTTQPLPELAGDDKADLELATSHAVITESTATSAPFVEKVLELNIKNVNLTVISDYMAELDLFYLHLTDVEVFAGVYEQVTEYKTNCRLEALVNNLEFMMPEKFIDEFNMMMRCKIANKTVLAIDDESVHPNEDEGEQTNQSSMSFEMIILDKLQLNLTKEVLRHLIEIKNLYTSEDGKQSDLHSHFQYVLVNNTESDIMYGQAKTNEVKSLLAEKESTFSFSNPFQPKVLQIQMEGCDKSDHTIGIDEPSSSLLKMKNYHGTRDVIVSVKPVGLKRYVEFTATLYVTNETNEPIQVMTSRPNIAPDDPMGPTRQYDIGPGKRVPLAWSRSWDMMIAARFDNTYSYSKTVPVSRKTETMKLKIRHEDGKDRYVLLTFDLIESAVAGVFIVNVVIAAPLIIENTMAFGLKYEFPLYPGAGNAEIPPASSEYFFFDIDRVYTVAFQLAGYDTFSKPLNFSSVKKCSVENKKIAANLVEEERDSISLIVKTIARLPTHRARTVRVSVPFLFANETDFLLFIKQRGARTGKVYMPSHKLQPFSWVSWGSHKLAVNVGNTAWSSGIGIGEDSVNRLEISPSGMNRTYRLMMEVKSLDEGCKLIVWRSWLNFRNQTGRDIYVNMNYTEGMTRGSGLLAMPSSSWLLVPKHTSTTSAVCPDNVGISLSQDGEWSILPLPISSEGTYTMKLEGTDNSSNYFAVDIKVQQDDKGLYVTFADNLDPPYVITNNMPFSVRLRRVDPLAITHESDDGWTDVEDNSQSLRSFTNIMERAGMFGKDVYVIGPHGTLNFYGHGLQKEEESRLTFQVSVFLPEEQIMSGPTSDSETVPLGNLIDFGGNDGSADSTTATVEMGDEESDLITANDGFASDDEYYDDDDDGETIVALEDEYESSDEGLFSNRSGSIQDFDDSTDSSKSKYATPSASMAELPEYQSEDYEAVNNATITKLRRTRSRRSSTGLPPLSHQKMTKRNARFQQFFSSSRQLWSEEFSVDRSGDYEVNFRKLSGQNQLPQKGDRAPDRIMLNIRPQGKTKSLTLSLPDLKDGDKILAAATPSLQVNLILPQFFIALQNQQKKDILWTSIDSVQLEYTKFTNEDQFVYLLIHDVEVRNMLPKAEYPVLFGLNRQKLHNFEPDVLEVLLEWSTRDSRTFVDYCGVRMLPFVLQIDGQLIDQYYEFSNFFRPAEAHTEEVDKQAAYLKKMADAYGQVRASPYAEEQPMKGDGTIYLDKFDVYPLDVTLSIGANTQRWPVISEAHLRLEAFHRVQVYHNPMGLIELVGSAYIKQAWVEVYKIIGNLDAIASPYQNAKKIGRGFKEFFLLPYESLVLDDTPGAFVVGAAQGFTSLALNLTDVIFSLLFRSTSTVSWLLQMMTLDAKYDKLRAEITREHPSNVLYGMGHGAREFARGLWLGLTGLVMQPVNGGQDEGFVGVAKGIGRGIIGLPLKPAIGAIDLFSKSFEGVLHTFGRGLLIQRPTHPIPINRLAPEFHRAEVESWVGRNGQRTQYLDLVRFIRNGRPLERYLCLTNLTLYIFNPEKIQFMEYQPKMIPLSMIVEVVVPKSPETQVVIAVQPVHQLRNVGHLKFVLPDRKAFVAQLRTNHRSSVREVEKFKALDANVNNRAEASPKV